jgi:hypothetical protein
VVEAAFSDKPSREGKSEVETDNHIRVGPGRENELINNFLASLSVLEIPHLAVSDDGYPDVFALPGVSGVAGPVDRNNIHSHK